MAFLTDIDLGFQYISGSIIGRDHVLSGKGLRTTLVSGNNQDATFGHISADKIIGVVADGCSKGLHSEVGANIGVVYFVQRVTDYLNTHRLNIFADDRSGPEYFLERIRFDMCAFAHQHAVTCHSTTWAFETYHRYTLIGVLIVSTGAMIFSIGDGVYMINEDLTSISFPDNKPPYFTYANTGSSITDANPELLKFQIHARVAPENVDKLLIASDGLDWMIDAGADTPLPGRPDTIGPVSQFFDDEYFNNPFVLGRRLKILNRDVTTIDWDTRTTKTVTGVLRDDTTIISIRRNPEAG